MLESWWTIRWFTFKGSWKIKNENFSDRGDYLLRRVGVMTYIIKCLSRCSKIGYLGLTKIIGGYYV